VVVEHAANQLAGQLGVTPGKAYDAFLSVHLIEQRTTTAHIGRGSSLFRQ
jgi:hypothetical protein